MSAFSFWKRLQSVTHALRGAATICRTQHNAWIHVVATLLVVAVGITLGVSRGDWALLSVAIALVWIAEALNTAIEFLADEVTEERRERIKKSKDVAAFGVLVAAVASAIIGLIVFLPHLLNRW